MRFIRTLRSLFNRGPFGGTGNVFTSRPTNGVVSGGGSSEELPHFTIIF